MRLNRAIAIVGMRRVLKAQLLGSNAAAVGADAVYFVKALLVNSSILPILLQALVLALPLPLQAAVQARLSAVVMAATSSSRGGPEAARIPCTVSLTHLVIVFEVVAPVLYAYYCDASAKQRTSGAGSAGAAAGGGAAAREPSPPGRAGGGASGGASTVGRLPERGALPAGPPAWAPRPRQPSALLIVLFGVGLSGVLFDVLCTMHFRLQLLQ
ncbi:conjugal transfer [Micractinium conductrix]|uniref:Conjugal transfer n=1 Tax=Micractinium conductrix TaxID=554055 RepID=A0A2P6V9M5_9CHLO|nr:conjugal transfer [Micractinium conductrix]|eukprot:PSC70786.1 conjugal transfer [Micractinium conductrix]